MTVGNFAKGPASVWLNCVERCWLVERVRGPLSLDITIINGRVVYQHIDHVQLHITSMSGDCADELHSMSTSEDFELDGLLAKSS